VKSRPSVLHGANLFANGTRTAYLSRTAAKLKTQSDLKPHRFYMGSKGGHPPYFSSDTLLNIASWYGPDLVTQTWLTVNYGARCGLFQPVCTPDNPTGFQCWLTFLHQACIGSGPWTRCSVTHSHQNWPVHAEVFNHLSYVHHNIPSDWLCHLWTWTRSGRKAGSRLL